jgi:hypothetical protein
VDLFHVLVKFLLIVKGHAADGVSQLNITAIPQNNYIFNCWSGDINSTINPLSIDVDSPKTIISNFIGVPITITFQQSGIGNKFNGTVLGVDGLFYTHS